MEKALLDTDILSDILKGKDSQVVETGDRYLGEHGRFAFSAITFYEVVRGFRAKRTVRALNSFLKLAEDSDVLPVSIAVLERAANLWADALHGGYRQPLPAGGTPRAELRFVRLVVPNRQQPRRQCDPYRADRVSLPERHPPQGRQQRLWQVEVLLLPGR
jgi:predicted nucleic acid-binding protein